MNVAHAKDFVLSKLEHGYYTFPLREAENAVGVGEKTRKALDLESLSENTAESELRALREGKQPADVEWLLRSFPERVFKLECSVHRRSE